MASSMDRSWISRERSLSTASRFVSTMTLSCSFLNPRMPEVAVRYRAQNAEKHSSHFLENTLYRRPVNSRTTGLSIWSISIIQNISEMYDTYTRTV